MVLLQAPVGGRYFRNKKKSSSPTGRKKTPNVRNGPSTTEDAVHPPPAHRPNIYIQQYSSAAVRTAAVHLVRGEQLVDWFSRAVDTPCEL